MVTEDCDPARLREQRAEEVVGPAFDLSECLNEPIHRLGGIQSYGVLLAADADGVIVIGSSNCDRVLGVEVDQVLGARWETVLGADAVADILASLDAPTGQRALLAVTLPESGARFDVTVYRSECYVICELEPAVPQRPFVFSSFYPTVRTKLTQLQQYGRGVVEVCEAAVTEIRELTGYDRVVAYRFEGRDGPGEVIAESVASELEPWLGLWFPATDIPPQARRLYERNWIRGIADVEDDTAALVSLSSAGRPVELDLSDSPLRTVSGFHLEYLRNIQVGSSMSVSLLRDGRLWGLIACHGIEPLRLSPELRAACELFGVVLSLQLAGLQDAETSRARQEARGALSDLVLALDGEVTDSILGNGDLLTRLVNADVVAVRAGAMNTVVAGESTPLVDAAVTAIAAHLPPIAPGQVWSSECLGEHHDDLAAFAPQVTGALVLALDGGGDLIMWLRPERHIARTWAADPAQPVRLGPRGQRLTPRGSSAVYQATIRGCGAPWTESDAAVAEEYGHAVSTVVLRHTARLAALNAELRRANHDLDTFAHAAAHELKEPLRGISNAATFITEDAAPTLDQLTVRRLGTIRSLAQRMDELINSLLHFAQLGQAELRREEVDLRAATERALQIAGERLAERDVVVELPAAGSVVDADPDRLQEILINLLVNAAKYAREEQPRTVTVGARPAGAVTEIFVRDNGIGIPESDHGEVVRLFRRLHARGAHGGGHGAGLAIVERIVQRHEGRLRIESSPGAGTTIAFTLEPDA